MSKIRLIDAIMGAGKTTTMQRFVVRMSPYNPCLYVTPSIAEAETRMTQDELREAVKGYPEESIPLPEFVTPKRVGTSKSCGLEKLLKAGANISCSHELLRRLSVESIQYIKDYNYIVVIDEAVCPWEPLMGIKAVDVQRLKHTGELIPSTQCKRVPYVSPEGVVDKFEVLEWNFKEFPAGMEVGRYGDVRAASQCGPMMVTPNDGLLVGEYPVRLFDEDINTYCMTYLFKGSLMESWCKLNGIAVEDVTKHFLPGYNEEALKASIRARLTIYNGPHNNIGSLSTGKRMLSSEADPALCKSHLKKAGVRVELNKVARNVLLGFGATSSSTLMTTLKGGGKDDESGLDFGDIPTAMLPHGFANSFEPCNTKSTNKFADRTSVAYCCNRFYSPNILLLLSRFGVAPNPTNFALTEMIQFIWRGCIRQNPERYLEEHPEGQKEDVDMNVYVPSIRMRHLLLKWLGYADNELF